MKKAIRAAAAALMIVLALTGLCGCGSDAVETIEGTWKSNDGYTLILENGTLTLLNDSGENALLYDSLDYKWVGDVLYVDIEGQSYGVFTTYLKEDTLKLTYDAYTVGLSEDEATSITLTRTKSK